MVSCFASKRKSSNNLKLKKKREQNARMAQSFFNEFFLFINKQMFMSLQEREI